jgi:hypothetical protein
MIADVLKSKIKPALLAAAFLLPAAMPARADPPPAHPLRGGPHDFDFEFGDWQCHLKRRLRPLTGSDEWVEYQGSSNVRKVWGGKANLGELELDGPKGHLEGLSLRLYNPQAQQWSVSFANGAAGTLGAGMIGGFKDGRGEFLDQEPYGDRMIFVRFIFSDMTPKSFKLVQAFSDDGGKTWEDNWIATFDKER